MDHQLQLELEAKFNKNQTIPRLKEEFENAGFPEQLVAWDIPVKFGMTLLAQMCLHKRATLETLVGILRHNFADKLNPAQECVNALLDASTKGLIRWDAVRREFVFMFDVSQQVRDELELYQYPLPMIVPPNLVNNNTDTGYLTIKNSLILRDNHHEGDICRGHINSVNQIELSINLDVVRMVANKWRGLDKPKPDDEPGDYEKRVKAFEKYDKNSKDVIELLTMVDNRFYLTHKYDKRGRCYCQGYHVNYQGNPWNKAVIELSHKEITK